MSAGTAARCCGAWLPGALLLLWSIALALGAAGLFAAPADWLRPSLQAGPAPFLAQTLAAASLLALQARPQGPGLWLARLLCAHSLLALLYALLQPAFHLADMRLPLLALSPSIALALLLAAVLLLVRNDGSGPRRPVLTQLLLHLLCLLVLLGGAAQVLNSVTGLDFFVFGGQHYALDWGSLIGLVLLCLGLGLGMARAPWFTAYYHQRPDRQVFAIGATLLLVMAIAAWLIGASAFAGQSTALLRDILQSSLGAHVQLLRTTLRHVEEDVEHSLALSTLRPLLDAQAPAAAVQAELQRIRDAGQGAGIVAMSLRDPYGMEFAGSGQWNRSQGNRQRISPRSWLFWDQGFWMETHLPLPRQEEAPLELRVQRQLPELSKALRASPLELGHSKEVVLCGTRGEVMACYPTHLSPEVFFAPFERAGQRLPMARALAGEQGIGVYLDYRERAVLAAHAPLPEMGLGMVEKVDLAEVHHSLFRQLGYSVALIAALMLAGAVFRYRSIRPMVQEMSQTARRLQEAQRIGGIVSWEMDIPGGRMRWSDHPGEILGLGAEVRLETLDEIFALMAEGDRAYVRDALDAAFSPDGPAFDVEQDYHLPDGRLRTCHVTGEVLRDAAGKPLLLRGLTHDVTERVRAERKTRKREALLNEAQRMAHLGSWEWDLDTDEHQWSDEIYRQLGFEPGSVAPTRERFRSLVLPEDLPHVQRQVASIIETRRPAAYQLRIRRPDGEIRHLYANAEAVYDREGRAVRLIGANLDVTERVLAEQRLAQLTRLYAVLSRVNQAIVRIHDKEELLAAICRIAVEDGGALMAWACLVADGHFGRVVHWGDHDGYIQRALAIYDRMPVREGPSARVAREGGHVVVDDFATDPRLAPWRGEALARGFRSSAAFAIQGDGPVEAILSFYAPVPHYFSDEIVALLQDLCQDIAFALEAQRQRELRHKAEGELRQLNEELEYRVAERTRALEEANQELESFSYSVSHDLRAPLRSIDGFSQVLVTRYRDRLDDAGRDYLERVRRASQRMGQLIDDLLNLSRVTRGNLRRQEVNLSALADAVLDELRRAEPGRAVSCRVEAGIVLYGDPGLLRALLENLLGNAWKFTRHSPAPQIEFGSETGEEQRVYYVRDNGAGFDPAYAHKLFKVFQRLHGQEEYEGTGIGLATVQRIVQRHRGRIWAEGALGQGATIRFTLPQRLKPRDGSPEASGNAPPSP